MELSKQDKKAERLIIENRIIGNRLQQEFAQGLAEIEAILQTWKTKGMNNREAYHLVYQKITSCDKHTATTYDLMTGGSYFFNYGDAVKCRCYKPKRSRNTFSGYSRKVADLP